MFLRTSHFTHISQFDHNHRSSPLASTTQRAPYRAFYAGVVTYIAKIERILEIERRGAIGIVARIRGCIGSSRVRRSSRLFRWPMPRRSTEPDMQHAYYRVRASVGSTPQNRWDSPSGWGPVTGNPAWTAAPRSPIHARAGSQGRLVPNDSGVPLSQQRKGNRLHPQGNAIPSFVRPCSLQPATWGLFTRWCNGNTRDFGSLVQGSNPCRVAFYLVG